MSKTFSVFIVATFSILFSPECTYADAKHSLPCNTPVEGWIKLISEFQTNAKTCQLTVTHETSKGECKESKTEQVTNSSGYTYWETTCLRWKTITWNKNAWMVCGGIKGFQAVQTCEDSNTTEEKLGGIYSKYDHDVGSVFIEQMANAGFKMSRLQEYSNGTRYYFDRN